MVQTSLSSIKSRWCVVTVAQLWVNIIVCCLQTTNKASITLDSCFERACERFCLGWGIFFPSTLSPLQLATSKDTRSTYWWLSLFSWWVFTVLQNPTQTSAASQGRRLCCQQCGCECSRRKRVSMASDCCDRIFSKARLQGRVEGNGPVIHLPRQTIAYITALIYCMCAHSLLIHSSVTTSSNWSENSCIV